MTTVISGSTGVTFPDDTTQTTAATASIPAGSKTNFFQAAAPTGWTQCTSYNDYAIRIVNGTGGGTGGTVAFSTAFASQTPAGTISGSVGATTLSTTQIPSHCHTVAMWNVVSGVINGAAAGRCSNIGNYNTGATGGGGSHTHSSSGLSFSGTAINLGVQYVNNIIAVKN